MNCAYCEERISDYLENALSTSEKQALDLHFRSCGACSDLLTGVGNVLEWVKGFPTYPAPEWLPKRIIANAPLVLRETWLDTVRAGWKWIMEPRTAMAVFTATLVLGWLGGRAGLSFDAVAGLRAPAAIYERAEGAVSGAYNAAVKAYYQSPLVGAIECRIAQWREIS